MPSVLCLSGRQAAPSLSRGSSTRCWAGPAPSAGVTAPARPLTCSQVLSLPHHSGDTCRPLHCPAPATGALKTDGHVSLFCLSLPPCAVKKLWRRQLGSEGHSKFWRAKIKAELPTPPGSWEAQWCPPLHAQMDLKVHERKAASEAQTVSLSWNTQCLLPLSCSHGPVNSPIPLMKGSERKKSQGRKPGMVSEHQGAGRDHSPHLATLWVHMQVVKGWGSTGMGRVSLTPEMTGW